ncbi:MAG: hypothetical protein Q9161_002168 [Pseudevernia consocians]
MSMTSTLLPGIFIRHFNRSEYPSPAHPDNVVYNFVVTTRNIVVAQKKHYPGAAGPLVPITIRDIYQIDEES